MVPRDVEKFYAAITYGAVECWKTHPQFDDIVGHANYEVWRAVARFPETERLQLHRLIHVIARQAAIHFVRSPANDSRRFYREGVPVPTKVEIDSLPRWTARVPDFAPSLIERLWRRWVWRAVWNAASDQDRVLLTLYFREGVPHEELGRRFGHTPVWSFYRLRKLCADYRDTLEIAASP